MTTLRNSILATLAYYDIFDYPLTAVELHRYLINPSRLGDKEVGEIKFSGILAEVNKLVSQERIQSANGFFSLPGRAAGLYAMRTEREKIAAEKFKKLIRRAGWFRLVPYLRCVFVSGSLALSNSGPKGDFDVLVVMKAGRLYTGRLLLSLLASLMRVRRGRYDKEAPDKFCFNHYITDASQNIEHRSIYTAYNYSQLIPVLTCGYKAEDFFKENIWINQYVYNFRPVLPSVRRSAGSSEIPGKLQSFLERILDGKMGDMFENAAKAYQQWRIRRNPATWQPGGRTIFTDTKLEFHPRSFEGTVIQRYNSGLKKIGIVVRALERDSGLTSV